MRRSTDSIRPMAISATESALPPDWFITATPARVQASISMVSQPDPLEDTASRSGQRASRSAVANQWRGSSSLAAVIW